MSNRVINIPFFSSLIVCVLFLFLLQLRKAVMDHISDSFLETNVPLLVLIEAAKSGNEKEVKEYAQVFREHANKLVEVSQEKPEE
uniref:Catenin alpha-2 n=1 Tax=Ursus americanus TaxID=9643 RepID=A0A452S1D1_URSAM